MTDGLKNCSPLATRGKQEAQLSQRDRVTHRVNEYFVKSLKPLKIIRTDTVGQGIVPISISMTLSMYVVPFMRH